MKRKYAISILVALAYAVTFAQSENNSQSVTDLKDGYVRFKSDTYQIDVPKDWKVSSETWYGQRKVSPKSGGGELGVMTAPPSRQSWDQVYQTALFYINREESGQPTPYVLTKTKNGYEAATFRVKDSNGFAKRHYVMIKHEEKGLLALSVTIPNEDSEKAWTKHFKRMVDSAIFLGE